MSCRQDAKASQGWRLLCSSLQRVHNLSQVSEKVKYFVNLVLSLLKNINNVLCNTCD